MDGTGLQATRVDGRGKCLSVIAAFARRCAGARALRLRKHEVQRAVGGMVAMRFAVLPGHAHSAVLPGQIQRMPVQTGEQCQPQITQQHCSRHASGVAAAPNDSRVCGEAVHGIRTTYGRPKAFRKRKKSSVDFFGNSTAPAPVVTLVPHITTIPSPRSGFHHQTRKMYR